jgi:hypothetical protein
MDYHQGGRYMNLTIPLTDTKVDTNGVADKLDDVRKALSNEADQLADVAAQISKDVGKQASGAASHASSNAGSFIDQIWRSAGDLASSIAASGRRSASDLGRDVQTLGEDLRKVRITTEPKNTGPDLKPAIALLGGVTSGLALMYFLDPDRGRRRRALLRDQLTKWTRLGRERAAGTAKDFRNRTVGVMHEAQRAVMRDETPSDAITGFSTETTSEQPTSPWSSEESRVGVS